MFHRLCRPTHNRCGSICHRNILPFHGFHEDPENFSLVLAIAPYGDVTEWVHDGKQPRAIVAPLVVSSVARALSYLHQHRIAHRDIKPENILVFGPEHFCLGDFGWACMGDLSRRTLCGTAEFISPEVVDCPRPYDAAGADLWSLGVLMYDLAYGITPFGHNESRDDEESTPDNPTVARSANEIIFSKIRSFREPVAAPQHSAVDGHTEVLVLDFCAKLMTISPSARMKPDEALRHPLLETSSPIDYPAAASTTTTAAAAATTPPPCASHSGTSNGAVTASPSWSIRSSDTDYQTP